MQGLGLRIYRERRRMAFVVSLATLSGFLFYSHLPYQIGGIHIAYVAAALYGSLVGVSTLAVCLVFPGFRFAMEAFAVSRLIYATAVASYPALGTATVQSPFLNATIVVAGGAVISLIFYSNWMGRRALRTNLISSVRLARGMAPGALDPSEQALKRLAFLEHRKGPQSELHSLIRRTSASQIDPNSDFADVRIEGGEAGPELRIRHAALPLRTYLAAWIDDAFGRVVDVVAKEGARTHVADEPAAAAA